MLGKTVHIAIGKMFSKLAGGREIMAGYYATGHENRWAWECRECWAGGRTTCQKKAMDKAHRHGRSCNVPVRDYDTYDEYA